MRFEGNGLVYIPSKSRFIRFIGGLYATDDANEIEVLKKNYTAIDEPLMDAMLPDEVKSDDIPAKRGRKPKNA